MGAIASHEAKRLTVQCVPKSKSNLGVYGALGLLSVYATVFAFGVIANFSIEKFEATMNVAAIAGFAGAIFAFWPSDRHAADAEDEQLPRDLRQEVTLTSGEKEADPRPKKLGVPPLDQWGPRRIIGFLGE